MMSRFILALVLLALGSAAAQQSPPGAADASQAASAPGEFRVAPFNNITSCLPFNLLIKPSGDSNAYLLSTSLDQAVEAALRVAVVNNTLYLGFNRSFETTSPIRVTVNLPADKLIAVENKGAGSIIINPGFNISASGSNVSITTDSGNVLARNLTTQRVLIACSGTADIFVRGSVEAANLSADGTSTVTLSGIKTSVGAELEGISNLYVDAATDGVSISASAGGLSKVYYNRGKCTEAGKTKGLSFDSSFFSMDMDFGLSSCVRLRDAEDFPSYKAMWSCGLRVRGAAVCVPGDVAAQKAAEEASVISVTSANAATPNSQASATATAAPTPAPAPSTATPAPPSTTATTSTPPAGNGDSPAITTTTTTAPPNTAAATTPTAPPAARPAAAQALLSGTSSPVVSEAADIRVAAAGRRKLQGMGSHMRYHHPGMVMTSSSSSSRAGGGRRSEAVAVASLECQVPDAELYIAG